MNGTMTADLSEIRDALAKATPGPWERVPLDRVSTRPSDCYDVRTLDGEWLCESIDYADAYLISNAPAWLAELCDEVERLQAGREVEREMIRNAVSLLTEWEAAAERVRELHYAADNDARRTPQCPECHGKAGTHPCGCWALIDREPVCGCCYQGHKFASIPWPCPTLRALDGAQ